MRPYSSETSVPPLAPSPVTAVRLDPPPAPPPDIQLTMPLASATLLRRLMERDLTVPEFLLVNGYLNGDDKRALSILMGQILAAILRAGA